MTATLALAFVFQGIPSPVSDVLGVGMEGYAYPAPVSFLRIRAGGQDLRMAYMDVRPSGRANGRTIFLLHGKNFFGAYWRGPMERLAAEGYRVVVPDQIGFGKSSKPNLHYSFDFLAKNTVALADRLGVKRFVVLGHSMGGMVAMRLARTYSGRVEKLVLENPIGLEDYGRFVPPVSTEKLYRAELAQTAAKYRDYVDHYYVRKDPALIEPFVQIRSAISRSPEFPRWAMSMALTTQMIVGQPTVYDLPKIKAPTLLIIGQADRTAVGKDRAPAALRAKLGNYPVLGKLAVRALPHGSLAPIPGVGHIPHLESPDLFYGSLLKFLKI